jgi:hypothetical protein
MRQRALRRWLVVTAVVASGYWVGAHVRLRNPSNDSPLYWLNPDSISIVISRRGSDDIDDESHIVAMRNAIAAWDGASGSEARLVEDTSPSAQARDDWQSDGIHLVSFDENDSSGYFLRARGSSP